MRTFVRFFAAAALFALSPGVAMAQGTSTISGVVKDASGAVLPGVTVEASSPALIEKTRTVVTDSSGQYAIVSLRPGLYSVTFTLPGFSIVKRDGVELTTDFTATINAELKVGALEETITVSAESPIVDVQSITARTVMTREVLDAIPTGRNIQAVGIMIPGTAIALGGGGALSRDVGGSGNLQQSPLQYRGSGDTVQTIEGLRLNNLCAQGAYSGVYWNDGSFQEISYVTGADSAEMGQGGIRVNMVPKDGGNTFHGSVMANYAGDSWSADNLRNNLAGDLTFNPTNRLSTVGNIQKVWDFNPSIGGPIKKDKVWFNFTFRHWGVNKSVADSYFDADPSPFRYVPDLNRPGIDDGHIVSRAARVSWQISQKDKFSVYHDDQNKYRDHWGISANVPPEAAGVQVTPTSFVSVWKWTRTQSNRLLLDAGVGIYDQEYTELYQPAVTGQTEKVWDLNAIRAARVYTLCDNSTGVCSAGTGKIAGAWNNPADHFSKLITYSGSERRAGRCDPPPADRSPQWHQGRHRPVRAGSLDVRPRHDQRGRALRLVHRRVAGKRCAAEPVQCRRALRAVRGWQERSEGGLHRHGAELEGHLAARRRVAGSLRRWQDGAEGQHRPLRQRPADRDRGRHQPRLRAQHH
jgi:Carboxypeptidase regulatory-like domain